MLHLHRDSSDSPRREGMSDSDAASDTGVPPGVSLLHALRLERLGHQVLHSPRQVVDTGIDPADSFYQSLDLVTQ